jgi:hypothetical protein
VWVVDASYGLVGCSIDLRHCVYGFDAGLKMVRRATSAKPP